ncbi:hypothetical protein POTOM_025465 [Populus tomentosa]|uniref:Uncharacterized protein n=1 Tax=Populus tomentosa TaxID=118781 RepID=A0A8X7ZP50_POPTO|nr:hypothetical protein POTOM_025465 [Populus tomentosa]
MGFLRVQMTFTLAFAAASASAGIENDLSRRSVRSSSNGITTCPASSSTQPDDNGVFVQTITKFLNEMRANPSTDTDGSASTRERDPE